jgi:hypothetical protein
LITVNSWLCDPSPVKDRKADALGGLCLGVSWLRLLEKSFTGEGFGIGSGRGGACLLEMMGIQADGSLCIVGA